MEFYDIINKFNDVDVERIVIKYGDSELIFDKYMEFKYIIVNNYIDFISIKYKKIKWDEIFINKNSIRSIKLLYKD